MPEFIENDDQEFNAFDYEHLFEYGGIENIINCFNEILKSIKENKKDIDKPINAHQISQYGWETEYTTDGYICNIGTFSQ